MQPTPRSATGEATRRADVCTICGDKDYSDGLRFQAGGGVCRPCLLHERAMWQANRPYRGWYKHKEEPSE